MGTVGQTIIEIILQGRRFVYLRKFPVDRVRLLVLHRLTPLHFDVSSKANVRSCENCSISYIQAALSLQTHYLFIAKSEKAGYYNNAIIFWIKTVRVVHP